MELSLIFDIAKTVLIKVISDLIGDKIKEVRKTEIRKEVAAAILEEKSTVKYQDVKTLVRQVMEEIEILSGRDEDLKVSGDFIQLAKPVKKPILPFQDRDINKQLQERLQRLDDIIAKRREEKELSTQHQEEENSKSTPTEEASFQKHFTLLKPVSEPIEDNQTIRQGEEKNSKSTPTEEASSQKHFTVIKLVGEESKEVVETRLIKKIREMDERIRRRRAGEYLDDDK
ncbi:hypothetical protein ACE1CI_04765 [Aerosakkonemataceae cyanobacterium BLCC-F50]|uniref:Uncharacterized protein n=1 Tax=Floridaenema flaviceps BLCC-F50 TaxID=3153642 RepID=A0ABV4XKK7_9CYAN